jgi:3-deoxy-D-manno-octulosonic-acid transferase
LPVIIYNIFLLGFKVVTTIASLFDSKAKKWLQGRRKIFDKISASVSAADKKIWFHCSSLGEFEQCLPLMERVRRDYPAYKILLTFFSPSGYEARKDYKGVDWIFYLPLDGALSAKKFLGLVDPSLVIFIKYDLWYYYIREVNKRKIPLLLVSAVFRPGTVFFRWYGIMQRRMLSLFTQVFVQNNSSKELMRTIHLDKICSVGGDTRFDRVSAIAASWQPIPAIEKFIGKNKLIVAGSTWPEDEQALQELFRKVNHPAISLVIAPHDIHPNRIREVQQAFPGSIVFSALQNENMDLGGKPGVLVIDNIGMLSQLYKYATIAYVGGGLSKTGVHNVLEAAVYAKPVVFGSNYHAYAEAVGLVDRGGAIVIEKGKNSMLLEQIQNLLGDGEAISNYGHRAGEFVKNNMGATEKLMQYIQEKRLLTI